MTGKFQCIYSECPYRRTFGSQRALRNHLRAVHTNIILPEDTDILQQIDIRATDDLSYFDNTMKSRGLNEQDIAVECMNIDVPEVSNNCEAAYLEGTFVQSDVSLWLKHSFINKERFNGKLWTKPVPKNCNTQSSNMSSLELLLAEFALDASLSHAHYKR